MKFLVFVRAAGYRMLRINSCIGIMFRKGGKGNDRRIIRSSETR